MPPIPMEPEGTLCPSQRSDPVPTKAQFSLASEGERSAPSPQFQGGCLYALGRHATCPTRAQRWAEGEILMLVAFMCCLSTAHLLCFTEVMACRRRSVLPEARPCKQLYNHVALNGYLNCLSPRVCCYFPTQWSLLALFCSLSLRSMLRNAPAGNHIKTIPL